MNSRRRPDREQQREALRVQQYQLVRALLTAREPQGGVCDAGRGARSLLSAERVEVYWTGGGTQTLLAQSGAGRPPGAFRPPPTSSLGLPVNTWEVVLEVFAPGLDPRDPTLASLSHLGVYLRTALVRLGWQGPPSQAAPPLITAPLALGLPGPSLSA